MSDWESKTAITELINNYTGAAGRLDIGEFSAFFLEDAEVHGVASLLGQPEPLRGKEAIAGFFGPLFLGLDWLVQQNTTTDIRIDREGRWAKVSTNIVEMAQPSGRGIVTMIGRYDDEVELSGTRWRFRKRVLTPFSFTTQASPEA